MVGGDDLLLRERVSIARDAQGEGIDGSSLGEDRGMESVGEQLLKEDLTCISL
jgi:hypothetical protein